MFYQLLWTFILGLHDCNYVICNIRYYNTPAQYAMTLISTLLILLLLCNMLIICSKNTTDLIKSYFVFFFNYIMYIQHNICSMNMKHCKKKNNHRGIMRLISNKNRSIAEIKKNKIYSVSSLQNYKKKFKYPSTPTLSSGRTLKFYFFFILFLQVKSASS